MDYRRFFGSAMNAGTSQTPGYKPYKPSPKPTHNSDNNSKPYRPTPNPVNPNRVTPSKPNGNWMVDDHPDGSIQTKPGGESRVPTPTPTPTKPTINGNWMVDDHPDGSIQTYPGGESRVPTENFYQKEFEKKLEEQKNYYENQYNNRVSAYEQKLDDYNNKLQDYFKEKNEKSRQSALDALDARLKAQRGIYDDQMNGLGDQYQALRNQSEVERYKSRRAMREALANRGQLDSGYGRQENLIMDTKYGNAINSINLQEQKARNDIKNAISNLLALYESDKTNINNQYDSNILKAMSMFERPTF